MFITGKELACEKKKVVVIRDSAGVHAMDVWCISKPGLKPQKEEEVPMTEGLSDLFFKFAAGDPLKGAQVCSGGYLPYDTCTIVLCDCTGFIYL